jgi:hypothetical protein
MNGDQLKGLLLLQIKRRIISFAKSQIILLEDLRDKYNLPKEVHDLNRKRVLDTANDSIREIEETLENLPITIKNENTIHI